MTKIVGILNLTPDSFSDGAQHNRPDQALAWAQRMFDEGAHLIDVGAESTRPGAQAVSEAEEWARLEPVLPTLLRLYPGKISLDTIKPNIARRALESGPVIVNDVAGMNNPDMIAVVAEYGARCIVSHVAYADIQKAHQHKPTTSVEQVVTDLLAREAALIAAGVDKTNVILDPGIGFGKTFDLNIRLLGFAQDVPGHEVMIGYSRKRFLGEQQFKIATNVAAGKIAIATGAAYLRVHDVEPHVALL